MIGRQAVATVLFLCSLASANGQTARALLVAIDQYPVQSGWREIHATNDLRLIEPLLLEHGFAQKNKIVLTNSQATKRAIVDALKRLTNQSCAGDRLYLHFSCHGQQMADDNGDETDGLDEALIPYDALRRYTKGSYEGQNHLRDDELGYWLDAMRRKAGDAGSVVVTLDACHSGTADRESDDDTYVRGTTYIFAPSDFVRPEADASPLAEHIRSLSGMAPLTVVAACMPDQLNYEYFSPRDSLHYGSLTYALCRIWHNDKSLSAEALRRALTHEMERIKPRRGKLQTPLLQTSDEKRTVKIGL